LRQYTKPLPSEHAFWGAFWLAIINLIHGEMIMNGQLNLFVRQLERDSLSVPTLGVLVCWNLTSLDIPRDVFLSLLMTSGIDRVFMPRIPNLRSSLRRSMKGKADLVRTVIDEADKFVLALVDEEVDTSNEQLAYQVRTTVAIESGNLRIDDTALAPLVQSSVAHHQNSVRTEEVARTYLRCIRAAQGIPVRTSGGVYFVPRSNIGWVDSLRHLSNQLATFNAACYFSAFGVTDVEATRQNMCRHFLEHMDQLLDQMSADLESLEDPSSDVLKRRLDRFSEVRAKAMAYSDLLHFKAEGILERIGTLESSVRNLLSL
jgi:hypothetical protein